MSENFKKLNDICLYPKDFWGSYDYYVNVFGLKPKRFQPDRENATYIEFDLEGTTISIWEKDAVIRDAIPAEYLGDETSHNFMLAFRVSTPEEVTRIYNRLVENGAKVIKEPTDYDFGARACYVRDYEDNIWEIFAWIDGDLGPGLIK